MNNEQTILKLLKSTIPEDNLLGCELLRMHGLRKVKRFLKKYGEKASYPDIVGYCIDRGDSQTEEMRDYVIENHILRCTRTVGIARKDYENLGGILLVEGIDVPLEDERTTTERSS